jgi:hypothetical protein
MLFASDPPRAGERDDRSDKQQRTDTCADPDPDAHATDEHGERG